jgi:hypothetical protein
VPWFSSIVARLRGWSGHASRGYKPAVPKTIARLKGGTWGLIPQMCDSRRRDTSVWVIARRHRSRIAPIAKNAARRPQIVRGIHGAGGRTLALVHNLCLPVPPLLDSGPWLEDFPMRRPRPECPELGLYHSAQPVSHRAPDHPTCRTFPRDAARGLWGLMTPSPRVPRTFALTTTRTVVDPRSLRYDGYPGLLH